MYYLLSIKPSTEYGKAYCWPNSKNSSTATDKKQQLQLKNNLKINIMNLDQKENYRQDDQNFQNDETRYESEKIETASVDHSISNNAEPDFGNDLSNDELSNNEFDKENLGNNEFDKDEFNSNELDNEFETQEDNEELGDDEFDNEDLGNNEQGS